MGKDPAFLFYPGDASNDTQFMNRLERGAYFDLMKAHRLFGSRGLTAAQVRHVLGNDFEGTWEAMKVVMSQENDLFFIPWVRESIEKREEFSKRQSERALKPRLNHGNAVAVPCENENENERKGKGVKGKRGLPVPKDFVPTEEMTKWAKKIGVADSGAATLQFLDYHRARGTVFKDWEAGWRTWMRNDVKFKKQKNEGGHDAWATPYPMD